MERESIEYDVVVVGGGPAGLASACKLKQLNKTFLYVYLKRAQKLAPISFLVPFSNLKLCIASFLIKQATALP